MIRIGWKYAAVYGCNADHSAGIGALAGGTALSGIQGSSFFPDSALYAQYHVYGVRIHGMAVAV